MKVIITFLALFPTSTFACTNVNLSNLYCIDSAWGDYAMSELVMTKKSIRAVVEGEVMESAIPFSSADMDLTCKGATLVVTERAKGLVAKTKMTVSGNKVRRTGERFVWRCDVGSGCDNNQYYLDGTESFVEECTAY